MNRTSAPERSEDPGLEGVQLRPMRREDTPRLVELMRETFGERRASEAIWLHRYFLNPWSRMPGVVAEKDGTMVATLGRLWRPLLMDGQAGLSAQGADLIVRPEYRGTGLRQRLSLELRQAAADAGAAFTYSFPGGMSRPRGKDERSYWRGAAGLKHYSFAVPYYVRVLRPPLAAPLLRQVSPWVARIGRLALYVQARAPRLHVRGSWEFSEGDRAPVGTDELWERSSRAARFQTVRDERYLRWRYEENPAAVYRFLEARREGRLEGLMVLSNQELHGADTLLVMDWLAGEPQADTFAALLAEAIRRAPPTTALALAAAHRPFGIAAVRCGFWRLPDRFVPVASMRFSAWDPVEPPWTMAEVLDLSNWFMTLGDSDVF